MDEISKKTADAIYVDCDGEAPEDAEALIDDACMIEYIPKYIRDQYDESEWCEKILPILGGMEDEPDDVQDKFLACSCGEVLRERLVKRFCIVF